MVMSIYGSRFARQSCHWNTYAGEQQGSVGMFACALLINLRVHNASICVCTLHMQRVQCTLCTAHQFTCVLCIYYVCNNHLYAYALRIYLRVNCESICVCTTNLFACALRIYLRIHNESIWVVQSLAKINSTITFILRNIASRNRRNYNSQALGTTRHPGWNYRVSP